MEKSEIESYIKAGEISKQIKKFAKEITKPRMKLIEIANAIDEKILELGGIPAFPVNLSLNEIAAHYTPTSDDETTAEGILKIDIGVAVDGFIADTALSIDLTDNNEFEEMIDLNKKILEEATKAVRTGMQVKDIGEACQKKLADTNKFAIIKSLSGHSLGKNIIHAGLTIPNHINENDTPLKNIAFAIEPFVTSGVGDVIEGKEGGIYILKNEGRVRDSEAMKILKFVKEEYGTRPFCARWLEKANFSRFKFALQTLIKQGILYEYPTLVEKSRKPVSQFENTFLISDNTVIRTTE